MKITNSGATTTVAVDSRTFKITYSQRYQRLQIRENGRLVTEAFSIQEAFNVISELVK
jgi:hypothetical protein